MRMMFRMGSGSCHGAFWLSTADTSTMPSLQVAQTSRQAQECRYHVGQRQPQYLRNLQEPSYAKVPLLGAVLGPAGTMVLLMLASMF